MRLYEGLSRISFLKKYSSKFLFVVFTGILIPLLTIILLVVISPNHVVSNKTIIILAVIFTIGATAVTVGFLLRLLEPLTLSKNALVEYVNDGVLPNLPTTFDDEAGILMHQLQFALVELDNLFKSKDDLVSMISHDARTPLGHIISYAELMHATKDPEKVEKYSQKIIEAGNHQLRMMESLMHLLKQYGMMIHDKDKTSVAVSAICESAIKDIEDEIGVKELKVEMDIPQDMTIRVREDIFLHVLINILHNAFKFSNHGGTIRINGKTNARGMRCIEIADEGIGFDPEDAVKIFRRFTSKGQTGTDGEPSTGLGLYISRGIVEKHFGTITAHSDGHGKGATFIIELPA